MFDFDDLETAPPDNDDVIPDDGPTCQVDGCGVPIPWGGRGRKPTKCADHKSRTSPIGRESSGSPTVRRSAKFERRIEQLGDDLTREFAVFGKGMAKLLPTTGGVLLSRAEVSAKGLAAIASKNPKLLAALETSTKILPALDLGETVGMLGIAVMVDAGRIDPDGMLSSMLGVSEIYHYMHPTDEQRPLSEVSGQAGSLFDVSVPPRFAGV